MVAFLKTTEKQHQAFVQSEMEAVLVLWQNKEFST
jgi:hypothetical protein